MSSTIRATREQRDALARSQLKETAHILRQKVEDNIAIYGHLRPKLDRADRDIVDGRLPDARDGLGAVAAGLVEKDHAIEDQRRAIEQASLGDTRGTATTTTDSGASTRDGWLWLLSKGRFDTERRESGRIFREKWSRAQDPLRSCIAETVGGRGDGAASACARSKFEIDAVRHHLRQSAGQRSGAHLFWLLEEVVGKGHTLRQLATAGPERKTDDRKAESFAVELGIALDMAGAYLGAVRV